MKVLVILSTFAVLSASNPLVRNGNIHIGYRNGRMECRSACGREFGECPQVPCEQPPLDRSCQAPACNHGANRQFVFPHADPTKFFQCTPIFVNGNYEFEALERDCGCQTYFDYARQACVYPQEWTAQCNSTPNPPQAPNACIVECATCSWKFEISISIFMKIN